MQFVHASTFTEEAIQKWRNVVNNYMNSLTLNLHYPLSTEILLEIFFTTVSFIEIAPKIAKKPMTHFFIPYIAFMQTVHMLFQSNIVC